VRQALPAGLAERVLTGTNWAALAAVLEQARGVGKDPAGLLADSAGERELDSAKDPAAVLAWRVRHLADLPPLASGTGRAAAAKGRQQPKLPDQVQPPQWQQPGQPPRGRGR
jgi:hypothetical protein